MPAPAGRGRGRAWPPRNGCRRWATEPAFTMHGGRRGHAASMDWIEQLRVLPAVVYAMALGGAIGFERELKNRPAGFRTHMLVAGTSALLLGLRSEERRVGKECSEGSVGDRANEVV